MKVFLVAGERSGDLHGGKIAAALFSRFPALEIAGWGGEEMECAGVELKKHYRETATMGFLEVLKKFRHFKRLLQACRDDISDFQPDAVVFIDFGAFNLRIAPHAKALGIPSFYFITPKVWAWNTKRADKLNRLVDHLLVILPFEVDFFKKKGIASTYVGNPLTERVLAYLADFPKDNVGQDTRLTIGLFPGSRAQEVSRILPGLVELATRHPEVNWIVSGVTNLPKSLYQLATSQGMEVIWDDSYRMMNTIDGAFVASGTATLEVALFRVPQVVVYKTSKLSGAIVRLVIKIPFVSLPNLIANREVVPELLQSEFNQDTLDRELALMISKQGKEKQLTGYEEIWQRLGQLSTSDEVATYLAEHLK